MGKFFTKGRIACLIIFSVLVIDQIIKIWIKTHMYWHESIRITDWFYIYFTENSGMAFGMEIFAKLFLTLFRIAADRIYHLCVFGLDGSLGKHCRQCVLWRAVQRKHPFADSLLHA